MRIEHDLKSEFRRALEDVTPPAPWLRAAVNKELRNSRHRGWRPMHVGSLVAALLVVLLIAAVVVGVNAWRNGALNPRPLPAGEANAITVKAYQAMISGDDQQFLIANNFTCTSFDDRSCLPNVALADAATLKWLEDLNRSEPPARFVALNALMRRHLALVLSDDIDFVAAFKTQVANGKGKAASAAIVAEMVVLERLAGDAGASGRGSASAYAADVVFQRTVMLGCGVCQPLVSQTLVSCQADQAPICIDDIAAVRLQLETFIEDLVKVSAPDSLAQKDASLQADLVSAYKACDAMANAVSAGDQVGFQTGLALLRQELARIDADATNIGGSH